jgi:manganese/zinc/iron transport system permease protein
LAFLQKRSLVGEALSHATYPGVVLSVVFAAIFLPFSEDGAALSILLGAFLSGILGLAVIGHMEKRLKISSDAALCFVLAIFFGIGVLIASRLQVTHALWFRQIQIYLFGQAATMVDSHIYLYAALALLVSATICFLFRYLEILYFDPGYAGSVGMKTALVNGVIYFLLVLAIVIGMRSVGVVLMSGMLIAPPVAARQWTKKLASFFLVSALFGVVAGFVGNVLSVKIPLWTDQPKLPLPTGPMIILSATGIALFSLLFSPSKGYVTRKLRILGFRIRCREENILKALYEGEKYTASSWQLRQMQWKGWLEDGKLTQKGREEAEKLVRLHRLWEVYLIYMGQGAERVHQSAEAMEHILTPEIEKELNDLLQKEEG